MNGKDFLTPEEVKKLQDELGIPLILPDEEFFQLSQAMFEIFKHSASEKLHEIIQKLPKLEIAQSNIYLPATPITNCQDFTKYWDAWHKVWFKKASGWKSSGKNPVPNDQILGWPIPKAPIWQDFPEPYWGNPCNPKAIFININPGGGGGGLRLPATPSNTLYDLYKENKEVYSKTVTDLGKQAPPYPIYGGAVKWHNSRAAWASGLCGVVPCWTVNDILDLELVPWHTAKANDIAPYFGLPGVCALILNKVIIPALYISNTIATCYHGNIIGKGTLVQRTIEQHCFAGIITPPNPIQLPSPDIFVQILPNPNNNRWHISQGRHGNAAAKFKVFVGGANMRLPPLNRTYEYENSVGKRATTQQIVKVI